MNFSPLTSNQVKEFLPLNTWTEVKLISNLSDSGVYIATTEEKEKKREEDAEKISLQSSSFEKMKEFKVLEIVAVEINGKWHRGKLISFNEFQVDDTRMELIDIGSVYQTKLKNAFVLPYYFLYDPLALPIKFKDFIPKTQKLKIRPLLSESMLHIGVVTVDVDSNHFGLNNMQNGQHEDIKKNIKDDCHSSSIQNMTNGHANISSSYISMSYRDSNSHSRKETYYDVPFKNGDSCFITLFDDFTSVYVVKVVKSNTDNSFEIQDSYIMSKTAESTDKNSKSPLVVGDLVKVFSSPKNKYYRAKILKNHHNEWCKVINIDLGSIEKVSSHCIYELADDLKIKPGLAVKIGVDDLLQSECSKEITELFKKFIEEKKVFVMEFDERTRNCLEHVKLKDRNGSYLNLNYLNNCLSMENSSSKKTQELNRVQRTQHIPISLNIKHITDRHQELISSTECNSKNICDEYSIGNSKNIENNLTNKTKKRLVDDFEYVALTNGDLCIISFFKNFNNIHICKAVKNGQNYDPHNTHIVLKTMSSTDKKIKKNPVVGDIVKAYSTEFGDMFRAEILSIEKEDFFLVSYIDFGNTEIVQSRDIFELSNELIAKETKLPVRVSIKVPSNSKETTKIDQFFKHLIDDAIVLTIEFNEKSTNGLLENVTLKYLESGKSVNDEILKLLPSVKKPIKNGDRCILTHFEDFDSIYVSKGHLLENSDFLNCVICSTDRKLKKNPLSNDIVKVLSPTFQDFYRAKILNIEKNGDFNVFYIDFGNTEVVQSNNIFELSDDFKIKPELAIKIGILIPSNVKLNEEIKAFLKMFEDDVIELSIEFDEMREDCLQNCILKVISSGLNVNEEIIKLFSTQSLSSVENFDVEIKKPLNSLEFGSIKPLKNREAVFITHFDNLTKIFVRKASENDYFIDVSQKVALEESRKSITNIKIGDIVKVPYDDLMSRALILDKKDENLFDVLFIDFGNEETVHSNQIFELTDELKKIPSFCIQIGMKESVQSGLSEFVENYFQGFESEMLFIEYDEDNPNGLNEASLKKNNNIDIFDELRKLIDKQMYTKEELKKKSIKTIENEILTNLSETERMSSIELKSGDLVFCSNFEDFDQIFLCKGSQNNTKPDNFNVIVDSSNLNDLTVRKNPKFKDLVWIKFEEKMLRAVILDKIEKMYTVSLLDIGKSTNVSADNIFEMSNNLKQIPGFATKVGLKKPRDLKTSSAVKDYFHKLWYVKPVPLTMICDESNFNCLNEVSLKKLSDGCDIIDDLLEICGKSNDEPNKLKQTVEDKKSNGSNNNQSFSNGDHVEILSGISIDNICIRSTKLYNSYKNIIEQLGEEKIENLTTTTARPKEIFAVFSQKKNGIYRAKIIGQNDDDTVKCLLIDFGLIEFVKSKYIFALPSYASINKVPLLTRKVTLADLTKTPNSNSISTYLSTMVGKIFTLEYNKNAEFWYKQVVLRNVPSGKSMNEEIQKLLSLSTDTPMSQQRRLERKIIVNETKENQMEKPLHPIQSGAFVNIIHFEDFNTIYVRVASYESLEMFSGFVKKMIKYFRNSSNLRIKETVNVGDKVCVHTTLNQVMYCRALVLDRTENECNVLNVDYGNKETVCLNDIFELPEEFEKLPYFAVRVQMKNMPQLTTKNEYQVIKDYFRKKIIGNNAHLIIEFNELQPNGLNDVIFRTEYTKKDIADDIRNLLNAPPLNIKIGLCQTTDNSSSHTATSCLSPYPARRHNNVSKN